MLSIPERERRVLFGREGTGADADSDDEGWEVRRAPRPCGTRSSKEDCKAAHGPLKKTVKRKSL